MSNVINYFQSNSYPSLTAKYRETTAIYPSNCTGKYTETKQQYNPVTLQ